MEIMTYDGFQSDRLFYTKFDLSYKILTEAIDSGFYDDWTLYARASKIYNAGLMLALSDVTKAIKILPTAEYYKLKGDINKTLGDSVHAFEDFQNCLKLDPHNFLVRGRIAYSLVSQNKRKEAKELLEEGLLDTGEYGAKYIKERMQSLDLDD